MTRAPLRLQDTPFASLDLPDLARELSGSDAMKSSRHTAATLVKDDDLRVVLAVAVKGGGMHEHASPGPAVVIVLSGEVVFRFPAEGEERRVPAGSAVAFDGGVKHEVEALEDASFVIVMGGHREASWGTNATID